MTLFLGAYDDKRRLCRVQIMTRQAQTMPVASSGPLVCFVWLLIYYYIVTLLVVRVMINCLLKLIETPTSHDFVDFSELTSLFLFFIFYHHCRCHPWCTTTATTLHPQAMLVATCHVMVTTWSSTWLIMKRCCCYYWRRSFFLEMFNFFGDTNYLLPTTVTNSDKCKGAASCYNDDYDEPTTKRAKDKMTMQPVRQRDRALR